MIFVNINNITNTQYHKYIGILISSFFHFIIKLYPNNSIHILGVRNNEI